MNPFLLGASWIYIACGRTSWLPSNFRGIPFGSRNLTQIADLNQSDARSAQHERIIGGSPTDEPDALDLQELLDRIHSVLVPQSRGVENSAGVYDYGVGETQEILPW